MICDNTKVKNVTHNGHTVKTWIHNGAEIHAIKNISGTSNHSSGVKAYITIDDINYGSKQGESSFNLAVPKGTILKCRVTGFNIGSVKMGGLVYINGSCVFEGNYANASIYEYTVVSNATITISTNTFETSGTFGEIDIIEY